MKKSRNKIQANNKNASILILLSIIIIFVGYQIREKSWLLNDIKRENENSNYPYIEENQKELKGTVSDKRYSKVWNGSLLIELSNGQKFSTFKNTYNYLYKQPFLGGFIQGGDSIFRPENTDSVYVYKNGIEYYFIIGKSINENQ